MAASTMVSNLRAACLALPQPNLLDSFEQVYATQTTHLMEQQTGYADYLATFDVVPGGAR